jgi:hypothetical protein
VSDLTKEKILAMVSETVASFEPYDALGGNDADREWLTATLFYITGVNEFARAVIKEMESGNG